MNMENLQPNNNNEGSSRMNVKDVLAQARAEAEAKKHEKNVAGAMEYLENEKNVSEAMDYVDEMNKKDKEEAERKRKEIEEHMDKAA